MTPGGQRVGKSRIFMTLSCCFPDARIQIRKKSFSFVDVMCPSFPDESELEHVKNSRNVCEICFLSFASSDVLDFG